jgi:hypothetical protein
MSQEEVKRRSQDFGQAVMPAIKLVCLGIWIRGESALSKYSKRADSLRSETRTKPRERTDLGLYANSIDSPHGGSRYRVSHPTEYSVRSR